MASKGCCVGVSSNKYQRTPLSLNGPGSESTGAVAFHAFGLLVQSHAVEPKRDQVLAALAKEPEPIRRLLEGRR